jgi:MSHA biogenesis protein MshQ
VTDYLTDTTADVTGTASGNVGRFYPADFNITNNPSDFATACGTGNFTYMGQPFIYNTAPIVTVTARALGGTTTANYDNAWWKLADINEAYAHNGAIPGTATLDASAAGHAALGCVNCVGAGSAIFNGSFSYNTTSAETDSFSGAVDISFTLGADTDGVCYDADVSTNPCNTNDGDAPQSYSISAIGFDSGAELRSGRGVEQDVFSVSTTPVFVLPLPAGTEYYAGAVTGWTTNTVDSCTTYTFTNVDSDITTSTLTTPSPVTLVNGVGDLSIQLDTDPGDPGGSTLVTFTWPAWLNGVSDATATFGVFRGDDRYLYWNESP